MMHLLKMTVKRLLAISTLPALIALCGCGQKGPLYLQAPAAPTAASTPEQP